jgi:hypothetical protein
MRIDDLANFFQSLMPKPSSKTDELYNNMWRPEDYPVNANASEVKEEVKAEEIKEQ